MRQRKAFWVRGLAAIAVTLSLFWAEASAIAASIDPYVAQYLKATSPVELKIDPQGGTREFTPQDLSEGKALFKGSCLNCHVGGANLPAPRISLALDALKGATPSRDNIAELVSFMRSPMTYDGSEETYFCREVSEDWMSQTQVENLAAFILRAAQTAPGWGASTF